jgi:hypothetical protein
MPVSLERLIAEVEPACITEGLTRECIQVRGRAVRAVRCTGGGGGAVPRRGLPANMLMLNKLTALATPGADSRRRPGHGG